MNYIKRKINRDDTPFRHFHAPWRNVLPTNVLRATVEPLPRFVTDCHGFPDDRPAIISDSRERLNELERFFHNSSLPESVELGILDSDTVRSPPL